MKRLGVGRDRRRDVEQVEIEAIRGRRRLVEGRWEEGLVHEVVPLNKLG